MEPLAPVAFSFFSQLSRHINTNTYDSFLGNIKQMHQLMALQLLPLYLYPHLPPQPSC